MSGPEDINFDENCDKNNPKTIEFESILAASQRIVGQIVRTPCEKAQMSGILEMELYLKQEILQFTGSFKERGVRNMLMLLSDEQRMFGVITASTGNHGCALSYHATKMAIPSIVVMPEFSPIVQMNKCEKLGAKLVIFGANMTEAKRHAMGLAKEKRMVYVNGYDHPNVIAGQGTIGIEIFEQVPEVDAVLVPCGGGGLLTGIAVAIKHLKPDTEVYGIETEKTCSLTESLKKKQRIFLNVDRTIADGLAVNTVGINTFHTIRGGGLVDKMVVVNEDWVTRAILHIVEDEKFAVEGAGASTIACLMAGLLPDLKGKNVVCICSGGNIDFTTLGRTLERAMALEGRLIKFQVTVRERPADLTQLYLLLSGIGITVRECLPERAWIKGDIYGTDFKVTVETNGWTHVELLEETIKKQYKVCEFPETKEKLDGTSNKRRGFCFTPTPVCLPKLAPVEE